MNLIVSSNGEPLNPFYSSDFLGWEQLRVSFSLEDGNAWEFDYLVFWSTPEGVYTARDSGCSCPRPFQDYEGQSTDEIIQKLERVGSLFQAGQIFRSACEYSKPKQPDTPAHKIVETLHKWGLR